MQNHHPIVRFMLLLTVAFTWILIGCATPPAPVVEPDPGILRVGVTPDAPPLIYKQNDVFTGLEADMAIKLAEYLNKTAVFVEVPWKDQIAALQEDRTDIIMSGMSVTPARQYEIAFSEPYFKSGLMILVKDLHKFTFITNVETAFAQSITWRIGVVAGTTGETFVRQKATGARALRAFDTQEQALKDLIAGRIDVFIHDAPMLLDMAAKHQAEGVRPLPLMLNEEFLAWGMRKNDTEMIGAANAFIERASQDGTFKTIIQRWIPLAR